MIAMHLPPLRTLSEQASPIAPPPARGGMRRQKNLSIDPSRLLSTASRKSLLVIGGPPLHGKTLLGSLVAECLPFCLKLESIDNLSAPQERLAEELHHTSGTPALALLAVIEKLWEHTGSEVAQTVVVVARFADPAEREAAAALATRAGAKFLYVEALSSNASASQRFSSLLLSAQEMIQRMALYENAVAEYVTVDKAESQKYPCLKLKRCLSDIHKSGEKVLAHWAKL